jgi:hypothetical protein
MPERILLEVHLSAVKSWVQGLRDPYAKAAEELLTRVEGSKREYDRTIPIEGDLWKHEFNNTRETFNWEGLLRLLKIDDLIDLSGAQRDICVSKVKEELAKRGLNVNIREDLVMDLHSIRMAEIQESSRT